MCLCLCGYAYVLYGCAYRRLCLPVHVCERDLLCLFVYICLKTYVWAHSKNDLSPPPDTAVPNAEIEKEEDESSGQAQTPAEESSVKVPPVFKPPTPRADCHPLLVSSLIVYFCLTTSPPCDSLCPGAQAH